MRLYINKIFGLLSRLLFKEHLSILKKVENNNKLNLLLGGQVAAKQLKFNLDKIDCLHDAEFKVYSQFGDDGIIQYLISIVKPENKLFIEFGVEDYLESNTRFLLENNNWKGLVIDGSKANIDAIKKSDYYWKYDLTAVASFITTENINGIISNSNFSGNIGILSIDIDGNDYWIWECIEVVDADIVIVEYNSVFGSERAISIPYQPNFVRQNAHHSYIYAGASLPALSHLANKKGYSLVGCNSAGNNAYFVKNSKLNTLKPLTINEGYVSSNFRETRDQYGNMLFTSGKERIDIIRGMEVTNVLTHQKEII
jgi:hypothetical protein